MRAYLAFPALLIAFTGVVVVAAGTGPAAVSIAGTSIVLVLLLLETRFPRSSDDRVAGDPQIVNDLGHTLLANGLAQVTDVIMLFVGALVAGRLSNGAGLGLWPTGWPMVAQGVLTVVIADGVEYWRHRLLHRVTWLWPVHALHHGMDRLHVLKSGRNTVFDMAFRSVVVYGVLAALGTPPALLLWYPLAVLVLGPIAHANVALRVPSVLHRLIVTPAGHRIHHARDVRLADGNFAVVTPLWDLAFGTFHDPTACASPAVGIEANPLPSDFVGQALSPVRWRRLTLARPVAAR